MLILIMKNITKSPMYIVQELRSQNYLFFHYHLELNYKSFYSGVIFSHQYFLYIFQLIYQLVFFYTYSFHYVNITLHHMIYHIHIRNY